MAKVLPVIMAQKVARPKKISVMRIITAAASKAAPISRNPQARATRHARPPVVT